MSNQNTNFEDWYNTNEDRLSQEWSQYLAEMQDSHEHIRHLANSDRAFMEWCEEQFDKLGSPSDQDMIGRNKKYDRF